MAQRKLQQEIDKVVKKVKEGTAEFDYLYDKLTNTENSSQKEKLEGDLKKEIKKLQRSRDQIKTWMSGNEVKDKSQLSEMRREIEADMEKFKDVEKEMKTKAFSKQGLNMQQKLDPREREKLETANFIQNNIEELVLQSESLEARIDALSSSKRKLTTKKQEEVRENQEKLDRNNYHQTQLETILRLLENGDLDTDDIAEIKEDIEYYVEHNQEDLFVDDDSIYDALGLESKEEYFNHVDDKEDSASSVPPNSSPAPLTTATTTENVSASAPSPPPQQPPAQAQQKRIVSTPLVKPALQATNSNLSINVVPLSTSTPTTTTSTPTAAKAVPTPKVKYASIIAANQQAQQQAAAAAAAANATATTITNVPSSSIPPGLTRIATNTTTASSMTRESTRSPPPPPPPAPAPQSTNLPETTLEHCGSIKNLLPSLNEAAQLLDQPAKFEDISEILRSSLLTCPDSFDSDKRKLYHSDAPTRTFVYYPQEPLIALTNNTKNLSIYDESTLFYIFYHHRLPSTNVDYHTTYGKYLQYSAAKELCKRGWWFNSNDNLWYHKDEQLQDWKFFDNKQDWINKKAASADNLELTSYLSQL